MTDNCCLQMLQIAPVSTKCIKFVKIHEPFLFYFIFWYLYNIYVKLKGGQENQI